ncbi:hypothetical protein GGG17_05760 [Arsenicicoccus sp. MKL-02]|uniref:Uncharacterized protein n=1 Tax=Arsenicicoccus cauae TaxID=2663847 RepID=A0A6I3IC58_9MICO|nr:hypothetical protein [Arsenicicoccus cauae]MTB71482.1 hypothetical protein [Arsenicicoccus cauae]
MPLSSVAATATEGEPMGLRAGAGIVGVLAVIYGLTVAFGDRVHRDAELWDAFAIWAGLVVLAAFVRCLVIPFVRWLGSTSRTRRGRDHQPGGRRPADAPTGGGIISLGDGGRLMPLPGAGPSAWGTEAG